MPLTLDRVNKRFGSQVVLRDFSLQVEDGERVCFFGPSGCGKTTLLRLILGLDAPDSGAIVRPKEWRLSCHFQEDRLLPWYTARENLRIALGSSEAAEAWLRRVGLAEAMDKYPDELSGGMRRRVSLARALGAASELLALDEPLRELDAETQAAMLALIQESIAGRTLLLVTHDKAQAEALQCRIVPMQAAVP